MFFSAAYQFLLFWVVIPLLAPFAFFGAIPELLVPFLTSPFNQPRCDNAMLRLKLSSETTVCEGSANFLLSTYCSCSPTNEQEVFEVNPGLYGQGGFLSFEAGNGGIAVDSISFSSNLSGGAVGSGLPIRLVQDASEATDFDNSRLSVNAFADSPSTFGGCSANISGMDCAGCELCDDKVTFKVDCSNVIIPDFNLDGGLQGPKFDTCTNLAFRPV